MATLKRKPQKGYASVAIPVPVHREMRIFLAANPHYKGLGQLIAHLWQFRRGRPGAPANHGQSN